MPSLKMDPVPGPDPRPPLGLRPRAAVGMNELTLDRRSEILLAMLRYSQANKHIPLDWILELSELNAPK